MRDYVVVIPSRNRYELALRAVRSAFAQSVPPTEVFLVDDASTDRRYQWLEEVVGDARLTVLRRPVSSREEHGVGFAVGTVRNTAIAEILRVGWDGWVSFLDDDDEWFPDKARRQFEALDEFGDFEIACTNALNRSPDGTITGFHHGEHGRQLSGSVWDVTALLKTLNPVINSTGMVHVRVVERIGLQAPIGFGEDWNYWRRAAVLSPILRVDEPLALYTVGNAKEYVL
jgi:glycosyltransferase involved in cell wall biosynthesis